MITRRTLTSSRAGRTVAVAALILALTGCDNTRPAPSPQYRQQIQACDRLPIFGDRVDCAARAITEEQERQDRSTP